MSQKLAGKVAIVTGASKGIGASIAKHLAAEGAAVIVNYSASKEGADRVVDEITAKGGRAIAVKADVTKQDEIAHLFAETQNAFGKLDILVNNAGMYEFASLENITERTLQQAIRSQRAWPDMCFAGSREALRSRGRQHREYQLDCQHP